jgi:uncharacterized protein YciI
MKYFFIEGTFKNPLPVTHEVLGTIITDHLHFLQYGFNEGWILVSGPKQNRCGGIILAKAESAKDLERWLSSDPLQISGVQEYRIMEFEHYKCQEMITSWFN